MRGILTFRRELKRNQRSDETAENGTKYGQMSQDFPKESSHLFKAYMHLVASMAVRQQASKAGFAMTVKVFARLPPGRTTENFEMRHLTP
jgi:hypothetical protein